MFSIARFENNETADMIVLHGGGIESRALIYREINELETKEMSVLAKSIDPQLVRFGIRIIIRFSSKR